ncbi:MAG: Na/Pi cotransporter family protein [Gammaproteobacteria bacterium]|nr:Na/Pi cotransporter family protein [Gammaproteobacteria bacterium]
MDDVAPPAAIELGVLFTQMGGGLALFLYGMRQMTESLKTVAGGGMKNLLARLTANRFAAALAGATVTAVIQSSSVTTVLVVGFISAGLLTLGQSIGVILGANVGTTITAQIIAFQVYKYGLLMIAIGFFTEITARRERVRQWGIVVMGLGLIFFGMELMNIATGPLRQWQPFLDLMQNMQNPLLAVMIGAVFTAIVQSSSATTGIVIVLAGQGLISLESGIGLIFGANIGTCVTAFISAFGRPREALQAAWAHVLFNVAGVLLWMFFIAQFADVVRSISPVSETLDGAGRLAADTPRQIANAHTLFNVGNLLIFIWFTGPLGRLVDRIVPLRPQPPGVRPMYLDELFLEQPALALDQVRRELVRLGGFARSMLEQALQVATTGVESDVAAMSRADDDIDTIYEEIIRYLGRLSQKEMIQPQPQQLNQFVGIANYLENVGDVMEKDLLAAANKRIRTNLTISPSTLEKLRPIHKQVCLSFDRALAALETGNRQDALDAIESKEEINDLAEEATAHIAKRLVVDEPNRLETFQIETDIIENLRRLNTYTRRIARLSLVTGADSIDSETGMPAPG